MIVETTGDNLPSDIFWLLRVHVPNDGDCIPFAVMILWHRQFFSPPKILS